MADVHPRPAPARTGPLAASRRARLAAVAVAVVSVVSVAWGAMVAVAPVAPVAARPTQDPGVTTTLAVDGSTTTLAGSTTVAPTGVTVPAAGDGDTAESTGTGSRRVADENRKIWAVVAGLVLVAIALSLLTIRYWRRTRPVQPSIGLMLPTDAALAMALTSAPEAGSSADAVAVAAGSPAGDASDPDTGEDTAPVPVVDVPPAAPRRAVAGADHAAADEAWEPRGTGEHERVAVAPAARPQRLSAEQRAALFARREPRDP